MENDLQQLDFHAEALTYVATHAAYCKGIARSSLVTQAKLGARASWNPAMGKANLRPRRLRIAHA